MQMLQLHFILKTTEIYLYENMRNLKNMMQKQRNCSKKKVDW